MAACADKPKPHIPRAGLARDGYSREDEVTATCYCGAVQLAFPPSGPAIEHVFACHCTDCHKITGSMFATGFTVRDSHLKHLRGRENLTAFSQHETIGSGAVMTNHFCSTCGTLMYRTGATMPGLSILRVGTIDDFGLHETLFRPQAEFFTKDRTGWVCALEGAAQFEQLPSGIAEPKKAAEQPERLPSDAMGSEGATKK